MPPESTILLHTTLPLQDPQASVGQASIGQASVGEPAALAAQRTPQQHYTQRLAARQQSLASLQRSDANLAHARLFVFALAVLAALGAAGQLRGEARWWLFGAIVCGAMYIGLVFLHAAVLRRCQSMQRRRQFYADGLLRLEHRLPAAACLGPTPAPQHPYAADLDLFGRDGIFGFLCTAASALGQTTLITWLLQPDYAIAALKQRQAAVQSLQQQLDLREALAALATPASASPSHSRLLQWATTTPSQLQPIWRYVFAMCHGGLLLSFYLWNNHTLPAWPMLIVLFVQAGIARWLRQQSHAMFAALEEPQRELQLVAQTINLLRRATLPAAVQHLLQILQPSAAQPAAATAIAALERLSRLYDAPKNQLFAPLAWLLLWQPHCSLALQRWQQRHGPCVAAWLRAVGELEALLSLSGYSFERPDDVFPSWVSEATGSSAAAPNDVQAPYFAATALAHPLLPTAVAVRNDVRLSRSTPLLIISGSNMSGKSTLLRAVGINAVLALSGAPVCAAALQMSTLQVGATLRLQDSLSEATSHFYAEIKRLQQLKALTQAPVPLLFLLDEILHGTNSHDRAIGAEALLENFLAHQAIGLVTTHDLSLSHKADALGARNMHFADTWEDNALRFDYRMRPGVVQKSNALALMQQAGLLTH